MYKLCLCALDFLTIGCIWCYWQRIFVEGSWGLRNSNRASRHACHSCMPGNQERLKPNLLTTPFSVWESVSVLWYNGDRRLCHHIMWITALIRALDFYNWRCLSCCAINMYVKTLWICAMFRMAKMNRAVPHWVMMVYTLQRWNMTLILVYTLSKTILGHSFFLFSMCTITYACQEPVHKRDSEGACMWLHTCICHQHTRLVSSPDYPHLPPQSSLIFFLGH